MQQWLLKALHQAESTLGLEQPSRLWCLETPKNMLHGDLTTNIAMVHAKRAKRAPRLLAEEIIALIPHHEHIQNIEIAGPGFINILFTDAFRMAVLNEINDDPHYLKPNLGQHKKIVLEFVSANPTGPLHVGHGRAAALGSSLANILKQTHHHVASHYFINDAGNQMHTLAVTLWLQYLCLDHPALSLPDDAYQGEYMIAIAQDWQQEVLRKYSIKPDAYPADNTIQDWRDTFIKHFGHDAFQQLIQSAYQPILTGIQTDLQAFKTHYDAWISEQYIHDQKTLLPTVELLKDCGATYEHEGALWFKSTQWGDDKDRVLIRANGAPTYFCSDIAYHYHSFKEDQPNLRINLFGADHHGYIPRLSAALIALGIPKEAFKVKIVQFVSLYRGNEKQSMSTRSGQFVTLKALYDEIGTDATRYFYLSTKSDQHIDFDIDLAKSTSNANPVFYIQYAHARLCNLIDKANPNDEALIPLNTDEERRLMHHLREAQSKIIQSAKQQEPQVITHYLHDLAGLVHRYYHQTRILDGDPKYLNARLLLMKASQRVMKTMLTLLGISAPTRM